MNGLSAAQFDKEITQSEKRSYFQGQGMSQSPRKNLKLHFQTKIRKEINSNKSFPRRQTIDMSFSLDNN